MARAGARLAELLRPARSSRDLSAVKRMASPEIESNRNRAMSAQGSRRRTQSGDTDHEASLALAGAKSSQAIGGGRVRRDAAERPAGVEVRDREGR